MVKHNLLKKINLGIASLALICPLALGGISNSTVANARRRPRTHRVYRHHRRVRRARKRVHRNYENILEAEGYENNYGYRPTRHHESTTQWYKNNGAKMFRRYINRNITFRKGINDAGAGIGEPSSVPYLYQNNNNYSSTYKHGWIDGDVLGQDTTGPKIYAASGSHYQQLKAVPKSYYRNALMDWNNGMSYLNTNPSAKRIYLNNTGNAGYWSNGDEY